MKLGITRQRLVTAFVVSVFVAFVIWIAMSTYWGERTVEMPLRGEAATNPFYAAQHFADELGAHARRETSLGTLPADGVVLLADWDWNLSTSRRERLERWVEDGGRLVVDGSLFDGAMAFEKWSLVGRIDAGARPRSELAVMRALGGLECHELEEQIGRRSNEADDAAARASDDVQGNAGDADDDSESQRTLTVCGITPGFSLLTDRSSLWALRDDVGIQAVRVAVGRGSVTAINALPFRGRELLRGDTAAFFVAATQLRRGDDVLFLSEGTSTSLLALTWRHGAPVVVLLGLFIALGLWRGAARFGPLVAAVDGARRSLAEQIRGTGQFALRLGGGEALHAAAVRALTEVAARRIGGYARLPQREQVAAVAALTGIDEGALAAAFVFPGARRAHELRNSLAQLEGARRRILAKTAGSNYGKRLEY